MIRRGDLWVPTRDGNIVASDIARTKVGYSDAARVVGTRGLDAYTVCLLHFNGANSGTVFTDETGKVWTAVTAITSTTQAAYGTTSGYFDGTGDYISTPHHADFDFGSGDFTIDLWMQRSDVLTAFDALFSIYDDTNNRMFFGIGETMQLLIFHCVSGGTTKAYMQTTSAYTFNLGIWTHVAFVRNGSNYYIFINGVSYALSKTVDLGAGALPTLTGIITIGARYTGSAGRDIPAYIDEYRISKGIARWTANFIPGVGYGG